LIFLVLFVSRQKEHGKQIIDLQIIATQVHQSQAKRQAQKAPPLFKREGAGG
jgi:hypothetical protein